MSLEPVPEIDVIIGTVIWLHSQGWKIDSISVPKGKGIDHSADTQKAKTKLSEANIEVHKIDFKSNGPDIIGNLGSTICRIECKGFGKGKNTTLDTSFDRAVASAVSYFDSKDSLRIGLAFPFHPVYLDLIEKKLPIALRQVLNLWILIYVPDSNSVTDISAISQIV